MKRLLLGAMTMMAMTTLAQNTPASQMERLDRGVVALPAASGSGNFVSWRLLGTDDETATTFDLLRGGKVIRTDMTLTNYLDASGSSISEYQVVTKVNGTATDTSAVVKPWGKPYLKLALQRPATGAQGGTYSPNDCSVGDVDGDGQYEIIVKWDPSNAKDNSQGGMTDNVLLDCYELDGTMLWRIDLGVNIRAGAHYTQFQVYDYDGDGRAELICKTAPGSKDGTGNYVNQAATDPAIKAASNTKDWRNSGGRINGGHEYLTVFEGLTGKAIHTIAYNPNRNATSDLSEAAGTFNWGDSGKNDNGSIFVAGIIRIRVDGGINFIDVAVATFKAVIRGVFRCLVKDSVVDVEAFIF
jgi:rhamnogalacturonan endolyase